MVYLTRQEHFNAAHKLANPNWTKEKNEAMFGVCANENWHGHNYDLYVTIKGNPDPDTGFLYDVKKLSILIKEHAVDKLDHKNLNMDVDFMADKMCSTENLAIAIWQQLAPHYVCTDLQVPFIQIRSISNYIGERDKTKWQMKEAIGNLNKILIKIIEQLTIDR